MSANASAIVGAQAVQVGDVRITELMAKIEGNDGSWFELFNSTDHDVDLNGCTLSSGNEEQFVLQTPLLISAGKYSVFASDRSNLALLTLVAGEAAYQYRSTEFELTAGPDAVSLSCNELVIDTVNYASYRPGAATQSRGWQLAPGVLDASATDKDITWCYTGLPILSEDYLYGDDNVASPGRANPRCTENVLPYLYINDQNAVRVEGIDFAQT
ncbi:MAG: lamin tail domain-containing protein, partial [Gammaproteobacteria bacterium]|nr:lamin tail domain-containing protein [Gammaproteobacteria bacterium]